MTKRKVAVMIINCWASPALLSFVPIFAGEFNYMHHVNMSITDHSLVSLVQ